MEGFGKVRVLVVGDKFYEDIMVYNISKDFKGIVVQGIVRYVL